MGLLVGGKPLIHRTQPAVSVETLFLLVDEVSDDDVVEPDPAVPDAAAPDELFSGELLRDEPESLLSEVIDEDEAPRLSVL